MLNYKDAWKLADNLTVHQIVSLIYDYNPKDQPNYFESSEYPSKFYILHEILETSVECGYIKAQIVRSRCPKVTDKDPAIFSVTRIHYYPENTDGYITISNENGKDQFDYYPYIDWEKTTIDINDFKRWCASKGFKPNFFFTESEQAHELRNPDSPFYAQKLHVAIDAWEHTIYSSKYLSGNTPRKAVMMYIADHASEYINPQLISSEQAKKDIAKVANWQKSGGAPKSIHNIPERTHPTSSLIDSDSKLYEWQFADELSIWRAVQLTIQEIDNQEQDIEDIYSIIDNNLNSFSAILTAIKNAVIYKSIKATIKKAVFSRDFHNIQKNYSSISDYVYHNEGIEHMPSPDSLIYCNDIDWGLTTVNVQDLKRWLKSKGLKPEVFFSLEEHTPEYCNPEHHSFSISLKAAYDAWVYTKDNSDLMNKRTFTEVVQDYFRDHSDLYIHKGEPFSNEIIENITRVINWTQG